jgi:hypothetical protein
MVASDSQKRSTQHVGLRVWPSLAFQSSVTAVVAWAAKPHTFGA